MGRTTRTFRMRTMEVREHLISLFGKRINQNRYKKLWEDINMFSSSASTFNWPDTSAVLTYCMLLEIMVEVEDLERKLNRQ